MSLVSYETMQRLRAEACQLFESLERMSASVGSAELISFDPVWAQEHSVGRFGRMTISGDKVQYHVAPAIVNRKERFDFKENDVMKFIDQWQEGKKQDDPINSLLKFEFPSLKEKKVHVSVKYYEEKLFGRLIHIDDLTLVNPSFSAMSALIQVTSRDRPGFVTLMVSGSTPTDFKWENDIRDFIAKASGRLRLLPKGKIQGIAYLGSSDPILYPETRWVRFVPSPFVEHGDEEMNFRTDFLENGFFSQYERNGRLTSSSVLFGEKVYRWNPSSVDKLLGESRSRLFLESSFALDVPFCQDELIQHKPFFLADMGEWNGNVCVKGNIVYDVREIVSGRECQITVKDTYMSRRARTVLPEGYSWAPFVECGRFIVTSTCVYPFEDPRFSFFRVNDKEIMSVDGVVPIETRRVELFDLKIVSMNGFPSRELSTEKSATSTFVYESKNGFFPHQSRSESGVSWSPGIDSFFPGPIGVQRLKTLPVFEQSTCAFIDISTLPAGFHCVASSQKSLMDSIPGMSMFFKKRWTGSTNWSHLPIEPNDGGLGGGNMVAQQIVEYLHFRSKLVTQPLTTYEIARSIAIPARLVEQYCYRLPDVFQWCRVSPGLHQWVLRCDIVNRLPDGSLSYLEAMEKYRTEGKVRCRGGFGHFHSFMLNNNFRCILYDDAEFYYLASNKATAYGETAKEVSESVSPYLTCLCTSEIFHLFQKKLFVRQTCSVCNLIID